MRALCLIREALHYKRGAFISGLTKAGYKIETAIAKPRPEDVLIIWQRYGYYDDVARQFEAAGARVIVAENGYLGKDWLGQTWLAMSIGHHNGAGTWICAGNDRWDSLDVKLEPWRSGGNDTLILAQRGIGEEGVKSPDRWAERTREKLGVGRIRPHPGNEPAKVLLEQDLRGVSSVVTWASSGALRALMMGVPVWYAMPKWIGRWASLPLGQFANGTPLRSDQARLSMFRSLAWAMWRIEEIESGQAFDHLLSLRDGAAA